MKENFSCSLTGKMWCKQILLYVVFCLVTIIPPEIALMKITTTEKSAVLASTILFVIVMFSLFAIMVAWFTIVFSKLLYLTISFKGKTFTFTGKAGEFIKLYLVQFLLTLITFGFYSPWYTKRITDYMVSHSEYNGEKTIFLGKGSKLFKYFLLALLIPVIIWAGLFGAIIGIIRLSSTNLNPSQVALFSILAVIVYILIFIIIIPYMYLEYKWLFNMKWKNIFISWNTKFWSSCFFILKQVLLTLVTLGIYWPVLTIKTWRYFACKTVLIENNEEKVHFGFEGKTGKGFCFLWGQTLLCIITLGFYFPWAYAKCLKFLINNTFFEENQTRLTK